MRLPLKTLYTIIEITYATINSTNIPIVAYFLPISLYKTAILDTHGEYKSTNTKKLSADATLKLIGLCAKTKLAINIELVDTLLNINIEDKINSLATNPTISVQIMYGEFNPIGLNIQAMLLLIV